MGAEGRLMQVSKVLAELRTELRSTEEVIMILERLAAGREAWSRSVPAPKAGPKSAVMESTAPKQAAAKGE